MENDDIPERVTRLETIYELDSRARKERQDLLDTTLTDIKLSIDDVRSEMQRSKGFVGGIVFVVTALWAVIGLSKDWLSRLVSH